MAKKGHPGYELINGRRLYVSPSDCFGVDQLLIADFAGDETGRRICDLGAGCGILSFLMLRTRPLSVDAVEIRSSACALMKRSVDECSAPIRIVNADIRRFDPGVRYDLVIANPPFRRSRDGKAPSDPDVAARRFEINGTLADFVECAGRCLAPEGRFVIGLLPERRTECDECCARLGLCKIRERTYAKDPGSKSFLWTAEYGRAFDGGRVRDESVVYLDPALTDAIYRKYTLTDDQRS